jgi:HEAT repeat protein
MEMESMTRRRRPRSLQPLFHRARAGREGGLSLAIAILALLVPAALFAQSAENEGTILELLRSCDLAVQGKVEEVTPPGPDRVSTARIRIKEWLKGETEGKNLWVAQELLFPSDQPSCHEGRNVLLFLDDLPAYSRWKDYRSKGVAYIAAEDGQGIKELDPKAAREASAFLARYQELASFSTQDEKKEYLAFLLQGLGSRVGLVQEASAEALVRLNDLRLLIGKDEKETLDRFLQDKSKSRAARRRLIRVLLAWEGFEESVAKVLAEEPEMRLSILQDLGAFGAGKRLDQSALESCLEDPDPRVRLEAIGFMSEAADPAVNARIGEMAGSDSSAQVRARAVTAASRQAGEAGREILSRALEDPSPLVVYTAADELRRLGGEASARELGGLLQAEDPRVRFIGILMLGSMEDAEARAILEDASERHADETTRDWSKRILQGDRLDARSIHQALGIEDRP